MTEAFSLSSLSCVSLHDTVFLDNTVLCNFAAIDRLDLLRSVLDRRGRWTEAVAYEARNSAAHLPALLGLHAAGWLGEPVEVNRDGDTRKVEQIRKLVFGGSRKQPTKHLGEAETCYLIMNWAEFADSAWMTDDREAGRYARSQGITTGETIDLMGIAVVNGEIKADDAFALMHEMAAEDRHPRLPKSPADFTQR
jgi:hypothetical protein